MKKIRLLSILLAFAISSLAVFAAGCIQLKEAPPIDNVSKSPTIKEPPTATKKLGESQYEAEQKITLSNKGPGIVSRIALRVALITTREPYQKVLVPKLIPDNYKRTEGEYGNTFAEFEFNNLNAGKEVSVRIIYPVAVSEQQYRLERCDGPMLTQFLAPEPLIESTEGEIVALARQLTKNMSSPCEKARAFYDWIGDNIKYAGYLSEDKGALSCLRNRGGDCTEFSYLMVALCRATGIPARSVEGVTYKPGSTKPGEIKHDWVEINLPGIGWVPTDPTWGRFKDNRDKYFARMSPDHIIVTVGNPALIAKFSTTYRFHYFEYEYWWGAEKANLAYDQSWQIVQRSIN